MATREERIALLVEAVGADIKALKAANGDLNALNTTAKTNLVNAINEIYTLANKPPEVTTDSLNTAISALRDELKAGAGAALDTFKEMADALGNDPNYATTIANGLAKRVRVDAAQTFTIEEKLQGCNNLGLGNPDTDFVAVYNTAKA